MTNPNSQELSYAEWLEARTRVVTSTDAAALLGCHHRKTKLGLWVEKKDHLIETIEQTEVMEQGIFFEEPIARYIAYKNGLIIEKMAFMSFPEKGIGSSFDYKIVGVQPDSPYREMFEKHGEGILEIKKTRYDIYRKKWRKLGDNFVPLHIEAQVNYQMMVSGLKWCVVGVMVGIESHACYVRENKEWMNEKFQKEVTDFYQSIADNTPPEIDYSRDGDFIKALYSKGDEDPISVDYDDDVINPLMEEYQEISEQMNALEEKKEEIQNRIRDFAGDASAVIGPFFKVSLAKSKDTPEKTMTITPEDIGKTVVLSKARKGSRAFKVTFKEELQS